MWQQNIQTLNEQNLRYSLTLTLHSSIQNAGEAIANSAPASESTSPVQEALFPLRAAANLGARPEFIYLRHRENEESAAHLRKEIEEIFENAVILCESL